MRAYVLNPELDLVPTGTVGYLYMAGAGLARGYANDPAATATAFVPDPFDAAPGQRMYCTGDRARWLPDGRLEFIDRADRQVKVRGFRVELDAIENRLRECPGVGRAAVLAQQLPSADMQVVACIEAVPARSDKIGGRARYRLPNGLPSPTSTDTRLTFSIRKSSNAPLMSGTARGPRGRDSVRRRRQHRTLFPVRTPARARRCVYAFEPHPAVCTILRDNTTHHGVNARIFNVALADADGVARFTYYPGLSYLSGLHPDANRERGLVRSHLARRQASSSADDIAGGEEFTELVERLLDTRLAPEVLQVPVRTVSSVIREQDIRRIDLLKINVERSELNVLRGIEDGHWPLIQQLAVEVEDSRGQLDAARSLLTQKGYRVTVEEDWSVTAAAGVSYLYATRPEAELDDDVFPPTTNLEAYSPIQSLDLIRFLQQRMPVYMVPSRFVMLDRMPLSRHGKIDYQALAATVAEGNTSISPDAPVFSSIEERVAGIWRHLLGVADVGLDQPFFSLGGDSLQVVRLRARLHDAFGRFVPLVDLLRHCTVRALSAYLAGEPATARDQNGQKAAADARARTVSRRRKWRSEATSSSTIQKAAE